jgi:hypothetical protein
MRTRWSDDLIKTQLLEIYSTLGRMPTNSDLASWRKGNLSNAIVSRGGFLFWASKLGIPRVFSDSDVGWLGEEEVSSILTSKGYLISQRKAMKTPYDIIVNGLIRIDVKSAKYAEYGASTGWFYRVGKDVQSDIVCFFQMDTKDMYFVPWKYCPSSNVTITKTGRKYKDFKNRFDIIDESLKIRSHEISIWPIPAKMGVA